ncbi:MAG: xylulokinase [Saccharofermentanales bacterium]
MKTYLIGVDIGTQGTKAALYDTKGGQIASSFEPSRLIRGTDGSVEQVPEEMYGSVLRTVREVMTLSGADPAEVAAIALDGQMAGILGINENYEAVTPYDSWLDTRCEPHVEEMKAKAQDLIIGTTGCPVTFHHGPKMLWWKNVHPEIYARICKFVVPTSYVAGKLAGLRGQDAFIDYTQIHFSGFADIQSLEWSEELLSLFNLDASRMPEIVEPWKIIGHLTAAAADQMGLVAGIPIAAGCGDQAAASLGAGVTSPGMVFDVAGTASVFSCCVKDFSPDVQSHAIVFPRSVVPGLWIPLAYISGGGLCLKWFAETMASSEISLGELDREAEKVLPGSGDLYFIPHFSGRTCPYDPDLKGAWIGLSHAHTRAHLYRSVMESIAYEYGFYLKQLRRLLPEATFTKVTAVGGGARSRIFNQIKSDVLGIPYQSRISGETATLGSAVIAGYGVEIFEDFEQTMNCFEKSGNDIIIPVSENMVRYHKRAECYESLLTSLKPAFNGIRKSE